jgi:hypothetical protein
MTPIDQLKSVLCDSEGKCCITGSDEDRAIIDRALEALEQQAEPVALKCGAIIEVFDKDWRMEYLSLPVGKHKLYTQQYIYTAPPQRQWVGLTDEEWQQIQRDNFQADQHKAIEAKLKERNT